MTTEELKNLINQVISSRSEYQNIELKAAKKGCPERLYDSLSSFSNQDDGGIIIFGIDESNGFDLCGVYNLQDIQQKITEQCNAMIPKVRPLFSYVEINNKIICSIEIPAIDISERPCYYSGKGRLRGSYIRVGTNDEIMTEYEVYSYEAYRKKYQDDIRPIDRVTDSALNISSLDSYINDLSINKPNISRLSREQILELMSLKVKGGYSLTATLLFGLYPQAFLPQLCIVATALPYESMGSLGASNERFADNMRIEGTIQEILPQAIAFVIKNTKTKTIVDKMTGKRQDVPEYPTTAVREVILNALVHRDYSIHTEGMPIQLQIYSNRIEVTNPGGLYGRLSIDQLGKIQPDTRNPVLAVALEMLKITENRYSGIPTIRLEMEEYGLPQPIFEDNRGNFKVTLLNSKQQNSKITEDDILSYCIVPRTRKELANYLGISSVTYALNRYIYPLVEGGKLKMSKPNNPKSHDQTFLV